jgi:hypothetical protein
VKFIRDAARGDGWASNSSVSQQMKDAGVDFRKAEYAQFKKAGPGGGEARPGGKPRRRPEVDVRVTEEG